jgi:hypothetical protein
MVSGEDPAEGRLRSFSTLEYHDANYRICSPDDRAVFGIIRRLRNRLEEYLSRCPQFQSTLVPLKELTSPAPESARRMHLASLATGVGPMAAVAGTFAQLAAEELLQNISVRSTSSVPAASVCLPTAPEIIIENGGDMYALVNEPLLIGLWVGSDSPFRDIAFRILPEESPLAVCSSSSTMGHSYSEGKCDLVTVFSTDASLADACATAVCNRVKSPKNLQEAVEWGSGLRGIRGILAITGEKMAAAGSIPEMLRHAGDFPRGKITRHRNSFFT